MSALNRKSGLLWRSRRAALSLLVLLALTCAMSGLVYSALSEPAYRTLFDDRMEETKDSQLKTHGVWPKHRRHQIPLGNSLAPQAGAPSDPYRQDGYMWWSKNVSETRFIPYDENNLFEDLQLDSFSTPPESALARAAPPYNKWSTQPDAGSNPELEFMRNKHVVLSCDSHCSGIVLGFCGHHSKQAPVDFTFLVHNVTICKLPALNFTLSTWFHFGVVGEDEGHWSPQINKQLRPHQMENRIDTTHIPHRIPVDGPPHLIIFDSAYWDGDYFGTRGIHVDENKQTPNIRAGLSYSEVNHHRTRVNAMIGHLRKRFPEVPIMFKPAHLRARNAHGPNPGEFLSGSADLEIMNQSTRSLMKKLGIPVMEWASKVSGYSDYQDQIHWLSDSGANWLAADMILYYLKRVSLGQPL